MLHLVRWIRVAPDTKSMSQCAYILILHCMIFSCSKHENGIVASSLEEVHQLSSSMQVGTLCMEEV
jgi:hypothetical protein